MRRAVHKESRGASGGPRGMDSTFELTPAACTGDGRAPLGAVLNKQSRRRVDELEKENRSLRTLLVDLNVRGMAAGVGEYSIFIRWHMMCR